MMAQKRLEWLNRDFKTYVRHKKSNTEEGSGEQRIGTPLELEYDMYGLLYVTTLHPEYLYVKQKAKKEEDEAKAKKVTVKDQRRPNTDWIEGFDAGKGKSKNIDPKVACYLELEKKAFEEEIKKIADTIKEQKKKEENRLALKKMQTKRFLEE